MLVKESKGTLSKLNAVDNNRTLSLIRKLQVSPKSIEIDTSPQAVLDEDLSDIPRLVFPIAQLELVFHLFDDVLVTIEYFLVATALQLVVVTFHYCVLIEDLVNFALVTGAVHYQYLAGGELGKGGEDLQLVLEDAGCE